MPVAPVELDDLAMGVDEEAQGSQRPWPEREDLITGGLVSCTSSWLSSKLQLIPGTGRGAAFGAGAPPGRGPFEIGPARARVQRHLPCSDGEASPHLCRRAFRGISTRIHLCVFHLLYCLFLVFPLYLI